MRILAMVFAAALLGVTMVCGPDRAGRGVCDEHG
jgi:hypothetical protein